MAEILFSWIGNTDFRAFRDAAGNEMVLSHDPGPLLRTARWRTFDRIVLLVDNRISDSSEQRLKKKKESESYKEMLHTQLLSNGNPEINLCFFELMNPSSYGDIIDAVYTAVSPIIALRQKKHLYFHVSSGTPAMTAIWIIAAHGIFPGTLLESSLQEGVKIIAFGEYAEITTRYLRNQERELFAASSPDRIEGVHRRSIDSENEAVHNLWDRTKKVATTDCPVIIMGETGTGKEVTARDIHELSRRKEKPFRALNCGSIPSNLFESELFGYKKGAFTGADKDHDGIFIQAHNGTVFLDEIGELPLPEQVKLLRVLQEKEVQPLGANNTEHVDVRIVAASNRDLMEMVAEKTFREDLYYRLNVAILRMVPLRERIEDIPIFVETFKKKWISESVSGNGEVEFDSGAIKALTEYRWPGNIRELENVVRQAIMLTEGNFVSEEDIVEILGARVRQVQSRIEGSNVRLLPDESLDDCLKRIEKEIIELTLKENKNMSRAKIARRLGLASYQTLFNRCRALGIDLSSPNQGT